MSAKVHLHMQVSDQTHQASGHYSRARSPSCPGFPHVQSKIPPGKTPGPMSRRALPGRQRPFA
jgi:hypothetical protein